MRSVGWKHTASPSSRLMEKIRGNQVLPKRRQGTDFNRALAPARALARATQQEHEQEQEHEHEHEQGEAVPPKSNLKRHKPGLFMKFDSLSCRTRFGISFATCPSIR